MPTYRFSIGDLVKVNDATAYNFGVVLQDENNDGYRIAKRYDDDGDSSQEYIETDIGVGSLEPLKPKMVTDGVITQEQYDEAVQFKNRMEEKKDGIGDWLIKRNTGGSKRRRKGKRTTKRRRRATKKRRRTMRR
jgi:hypothetical protein